MSQSNKQNKRQNEYYGLDTVETFAATEIEQETFSFLWQLKNYSEFNNFPEIRSPIFKGGSKSNHSWQLKLYPKYKFEGKDYFAVYLNLTDFGDNNVSVVKAQFQVDLLNKYGQPVRQVGGRHNAFEFTKGADWGGKLILTSDLNTENNYIDVHCKVWIDGDLKHKVYDGGVAKKFVHRAKMAKKRKEELSKDLGRIYHESVMTDLTILTTENRLSAHKAVLSARSSVFAVMFQTNMSEKERNIVEIPDFEEAVVKGMLEYLYTGETGAINQLAPDLLRIAEKYDLRGLKEDCEDAICCQITVDTAAEMLNYACMHNAILLKQYVLDFIKRNKDDVKKTCGFKNLANAHANVLMELYMSE